MKEQYGHWNIYKPTKNQNMCVHVSQMCLNTYKTL